MRIKELETEDNSNIILYELCRAKWSVYMKTTMSIDYVVKEFYNMIWKTVYLRRILTIEDVENRTFKIIVVDIAFNV
ncbi:MAG: hypothetical protein QXH99_05145 [Sulfolobales archaeon]|jgi:hypothetical protein